MAIRIEWKPVLQALPLKDYHADYGDVKIMVCVNPQPGFWAERRQLLAEYTRRSDEAELLQKKAEIASPERKQEAEILAGQTAAAFLEWGAGEFVPAMHAWFAKLWSFGGDQYTVEDIRQYQEIDPHFVNWLTARSIEMIDQHASARKKA